MAQIDLYEPWFSHRLVLVVPPADGRWRSPLTVRRGAGEAPTPADVGPASRMSRRNAATSTGAIEALEKATLAAPGTASLYARLSQAYATAGYAEAALHAIDGALALAARSGRVSPRTSDTGHVGWRLPGRAGHLSRVCRPPIRMISTLPSASPGRARGPATPTRRSSSTSAISPATVRTSPCGWSSRRPSRGEATAAAAIKAIDTYKARGGDTDRYLAETAAVLASAGRPGKADDLASRLLAQSPGNYELNFTHAMALAGQERAKDARASLDILRQLGRIARRRAPRSVCSARSCRRRPNRRSTIYGDSDNLAVQRFAPRAVVALSSGTQFSAGYERSRLEARARQRPGWYRRRDAGAITTTCGPVPHSDSGPIAINGQVGYATSGGARPHDIWHRDRRATRGQHPIHAVADVGPAGRLAEDASVSAWWPSPTARRSTGHRRSARMSSSMASYQQLSDGNRRWEITFSPRRTVARAAGFNLDLGASVYRLETSHDFDHGYYDPRRYEYYAATMYPYFKVRENVGVGIMAGLGVQRDNTSPSFHFGGNVGGGSDVRHLSTLGIEAEWQRHAQRPARQRCVPWIRRQRGAGPPVLNLIRRHGR